MESFLFYLLRTAIVSALFYGFYKLLLSKTTFHAINRIALSVILFAIAIIPLFRYNFLYRTKSQTPLTDKTFTIDFSTIPITETIAQQTIQIYWAELLVSIYFTALALFLARYLLGVFQMRHIIRQSEKQTLADRSILCLTKRQIAPFSWQKYIVIAHTEHRVENHAVLNHERAHVRLHHSTDRLLFDFAAIVLWFNPFAWLLRRELQSVHEFQADEHVITQGIDAKTYQLLLIRKSVGEMKFAMANNFLQRDLQKRITMMMKNKTNNNRKWNYAIAIPVLAISLTVLSIPKLNANIPEKSTDDIRVEKEKSRNQTSDSIMISEAVDLTKNPIELKNSKIVSKKEFEDKIMTLSGIVTSNGKSISGVAIVIKGKASGTVTDSEGHFAIQASKGDVLQFMMIGYQAFEYTIKKAQDKLIIELIPDNEIEVKGEITNIRNKNGKQPLYIVDDITMQDGYDLKKIDPNNIESITILKDKSATALYGNEGKEGVILIKTKTSENKHLNLNKILEDNPLIVVDGKRMDETFDLNTINSKEIESISILKKKSAIEIYGKEGKNGVIIITKKIKK